MSKCQQAVALLIGAFHEYSGKEGDKLTLSKGELKELLSKEFGDLLGKSPDQAKLDKMFKDLDNNQDGKVDFQEIGDPEVKTCMVQKLRDVRLSDGKRS
ncbi:hypothetical protein UPYG_G00154470 [Umbra pygmaea]|uniref:EF-hand domain-containing protein n=1 Tax=Umbra pygmaea TaxID=75934 RepID=A0ABD0X1X6_UMBPY